MVRAWSRDPLVEKYVIDRAPVLTEELHPLQGTTLYNFQENNLSQKWIRMPWSAGVLRCPKWTMQSFLGIMFGTHFYSLVKLMQTEQS